MSGAIRLIFRRKSLAKHTRRYVAGQSMEISLVVKNIGHEPFPAVPMELTARIEWITRQSHEFSGKMLANAIPPGEEKLLVTEKINCLSGGGYVLVFVDGYLEGTCEPFETYDAEGNRMRPFFGTVGQVNGSLNWNGGGHFMDAADSFWVDRRSDIHIFWAMVLSGIAATVAVAGFIVSIILRIL